MAPTVTLSNNSVWNLTGNSNLPNLTTNVTSPIGFSAPSGGAFKTLTVNNYVGNGGMIALNTVLAGDGSGTIKTSAAS